MIDYVSCLISKKQKQTWFHNKIKTVLYVITGKERQVWADKVRELDESSVEEEQHVKEAPLEEDFMEAQV